MNLSDYKGMDGIDLIADLLGPLSVIANDTEFRKSIKNMSNNLEIVQALLRSHKREILEMMAYIDREDVETYEPDIFELPFKLMDIVKMPQIKILFISQSQRKEQESSGSATGNTEDHEELISS